VRRGKNQIISVLAPLPWERGWGEVDHKKQESKMEPERNKPADKITPY